MKFLEHQYPRDEKLQGIRIEIPLSGFEVQIVKKNLIPGYHDIKSQGFFYRAAKNIVGMIVVNLDFIHENLLPADR